MRRLIALSAAIGLACASPDIPVRTPNPNLLGYQNNRASAAGKANCEYAHPQTARALSQLNFTQKQAVLDTLPVVVDDATFTYTLGDSATYVCADSLNEGDVMDYKYVIKSDSTLAPEPIPRGINLALVAGPREPQVKRHQEHFYECHYAPAAIQRRRVHAMTQGADGWGDSADPAMIVESERTIDALFCPLSMASIENGTLVRDGLVLRLPWMLDDERYTRK